MNIKKKRFCIVGAISIVSIILICILIQVTDKKKYDPKTTVLVTVDGKDVYLDEVLYHVTLSRMQGQLYSSFVNDEDYMSKDYGDGRKVGDVMKEEALDNAIRYELLYDKAIEQGYTLTDEETKDCQDKRDNILLTIPQKDMEATGLTSDKLLEIQEKIVLATRFYEEVYKDVDSETAYEQMKDGHVIKLNKKVWRTIVF